jgi:D-inositol-3-phosphate glycosyltransferase
MAEQARRAFAKPLIITYHSLGIVRKRTQEKFLGKTEDEKTFLERLAIERELASESSLIITLCESEKEDLIAHYGADPSKIAVVPGGVNLGQFKPISKDKARDAAGFDKKDFLLLFVGRLEWRKGVATLLHAVRILANVIPNVKLAVVGGRIFGKKANGDDMKEYSRLAMIADKIGIADRVRFTGAISHGYLPNVYSAADALIVPSYYEQFGLVALEGLSAGVPVIASRTGGLMATIDDGKNGLLFEPRNPPDLAEKILTLYRSPQMAAELTRRGREDVQRYSWSRIGKEIADLYEPLIKEPEHAQDRALSAV